MKEPFVSIFDPAVKAIPIQDNNDPLVSVADCYKCFISYKYEEYYPTFKLIRQSVFDRLNKAAQDLPKDLYFIFVEGHRPLEVQEGYFSQYSNVLRKNHPEWDEDQIFIEAAKLFAPPSKIPPHSTGSAIDITLCDKNGSEINMGSPIDDDPDKNEGKNFMLCEALDPEARKNREILYDVMTKNGFVHYDYEWWHWSFGDQYWAFKKQQKTALYDSIDAQNHPLWRTPKIMDVMASIGV